MALRHCCSHARRTHAVGSCAGATESASPPTSGRISARRYLRSFSVCPPSGSQAVARTETAMQAAGFVQCRKSRNEDVERPRRQAGRHARHVTRKCVIRRTWRRPTVLAIHRRHRAVRRGAGSQQKTAGRRHDQGCGNEHLDPDTPTFSVALNDARRTAKAVSGDRTELGSCWTNVSETRGSG